MMRFPTLLALTSAALAVMLSGCVGEERSSEAYCSKYRDGFEQIKEQYPQIDQYSSADPLTTLVSLPSALGDITALIRDIAEVSPDEIQTDVERVHENFKAQMESVEKVASDPLSGLIGIFARGLTDSGAFKRMDEYTVQNCGEHMFAASPQK